MCKRCLFLIVNFAACLCLATPAFAQKAKRGVTKPPIAHNTAEAEYEKGNLAYDRKDWAKAVAHYNAALGLKADLAPAVLNRGRAYMLDGKLDAAIADLRKACELTPTFPLAHTWLAAAYLEKGEHADAIDAAGKSLKLDAKQAWAFYLRGTAFIHRGEFAKAVEDLTESDKLHPNDAMVYNNRGIAYQKLGDEKNAKADFARRDQLQGTKQAALTRLQQAETEYKAINAHVEAHENRIRTVGSIRVPPGVPRPRIDPVPQELLQRRAQAWNVLQEALRAYKQTP